MGGLGTGIGAKQLCERNRGMSIDTESGFLMPLWNLFGLGSQASTDKRYDVGGGRKAYASAYGVDGTAVRNPAFNLGEYMQAEVDRKKRYEVYRQMDKTDTVSSIVDSYAEDASQPNPDTGLTVWVTSRNKGIVRELARMFRNIELEAKIFPIIREMTLMGDDFERVIYSSEKGVEALIPARTETMNRREDIIGRLRGFSQDGRKFTTYETNPDGTPADPKSDQPISNPWDYIHFRIMSGRRSIPSYGQSAVSGLERPWKQQVLSEDAKLLYMLQRAPDRLKWMIDVGSADEISAIEITEQFRRRIRKNTFLDPGSAKYQHQFNALSPIDDIFMPTRPGSATSVDVLPGSNNADDMSGSRYFLEKMYNASLMPMSYAGYADPSGSMFERKYRLANQSLPYARRVKRVQRGVRVGLRQLCELHLTLIDPDMREYNWREEGNDFDIIMEPVSYLDEYDRLDLMTQRANIVQVMGSLGMDVDSLDRAAYAKYLFTEYLKLPRPLVTRMFRVAKEVPPEEQNPGEGGGNEEEQPERKPAGPRRPLTRPQVGRDDEEREPEDGETTDDTEESTDEMKDALTVLNESSPFQAMRLSAMLRDVAYDRGNRETVPLPPKKARVASQNLPEPEEE